MCCKHPLAIALLIGLGVHSVQANETINRKRDKPVSGEVTAVSKTEVTVKVTSPKADTLKIPANEIVSIDWTGDSPDLKVARQDENGLRLQKSLDGYVKSQGATKATNPAAKADLEFAIARVNARMALQDPAKVDDAIKKLEDFRSKNGDHYRFYEGVYFLGQLYSAKKDAAKARQTFEQLAKAPWKESQMASRIAVGRLMLSEGKLDEAATEYDAVIAVQADGPLEVSARQEAMLGKSRIMITQKKFDDALKLLDEVITKAPADDTKVNAEAYLRQGDCLREQGNDKDALLAYLHVDVLFRAEKAMHAEALYRLSQLFEKLGQKPRAEEARELLRSEYDSSEWAKLLKAPANAPTN
ncbi:MAG: tetratricopeptide repeat protein [Planctomycetes bacterium]|nr:tetratricopeptide repeat protein [Planctomycetota bacterium]